MDKNISTGASSSRWLWIAAIWFGVGLFDATQTVFSMRAQGMHHAWVKVFVTSLFAWVPMALATPVILKLVERYPPTRLRLAKSWLFHITAWGSICLISSVWFSAFEHFLNPWAEASGPGPFLHQLRLRFGSSLVSFLVLYIAIVGIGYALDSRDRLARQQTETARLSEQLSRAQLDSIRRQVEPHFLFNSLNAIAVLEFCADKLPTAALSETGPR